MENIKSIRLKEKFLHKCFRKRNRIQLKYWYRDKKCKKLTRKIYDANELFMMDSNQYILLKPIDVLDEKNNNITLERGSIILCGTSTDAYDIVKIGHVIGPNEFECCIDSYIFNWDDGVFYIGDNKSYYISRRQLARYTIPFCQNVCISLYLNRQKLDFSFFKNKKEVKYKGFPTLNLPYKEFMLLKMLAITYDVVTNFEDEIVRAFYPSLFNILNDLNNLLNEVSGNDVEELMQSSYDCIMDIYKSVLSFGEVIEDCPSAYELKYGDKIEKILSDLEIQKQKEEIAREKKNDFLLQLKYRKELLQDFNKPLIRD
jgi:hypothetical protein